VATSIAAFVGATKSGPTDAPVAVRSFADFTAQFGGLSDPHPLSYAVQHYFANGGREALIARVAPAGTALTDADISDAALAAQKRGLWLLDNVARFNILCIPPLTRTADVGRATWDAAANYAAQRGVIVIVDAPAGWASASDATNGLPALISRDAAVTPRAAGGAVAGSYAMTITADDDGGAVAVTPATLGASVAVYFPRLQALDPLRGNQVASFAPCGAVAGIYASTDETRGVWKAPAGEQAIIHGAQGLSVTLPDNDSGDLNALGINNLRKLPSGALVVWGARTLDTGDRRYVPVVRTELYVEQSIRQSLQWAIFEPNAEPLWAQIRASIGAFLYGLWKQGALQGATPTEAYFVRCDRTTMTQSDLDNGRLNVVIGIAPLKPAEFVIFAIGQWTAQSQRAFLARHLQLAMGRYSVDVSWDGTLIAGVTHVRGLAQTTELITHREGGDPGAAHLAAGRTSYGPVTLVRPAGVDDAFTKWAKAVREGAAAPRKHVRIEIRDRESGRMIAWRLTGAVPIKFDAPEFNASGNDVAIEELVLGCERLELV
jgi:phage tail-like protein